MKRRKQLSSLVPPLRRMPEITVISSLVLLEDSVLIQRAITGQSECFEVLVDRHFSAVRRCISAMVPRTPEREDLVQNVLLKVWRHLATFRSESNLSTWITRIAVNEVLQFYRRERRHAVCQGAQDLDVFASANDSPYAASARVEAIKTIRRGIARLPESYRRVLVLGELNQLSNRETARSVQLTIPAVKTRLFRARVMLRRVIQQSQGQGR
jgi:RNA polymerase sigma-70 factor, ECF subfamily